MLSSSLRTTAGPQSPQSNPSFSKSVWLFPRLILVPLVSNLTPAVPTTASAKPSTLISEHAQPMAGGCLMDFVRWLWEVGLLAPCISGTSAPLLLHE
jgi:hypothetical protein